jgi:hydroxymethylglutaryl-CoA lyase
VAPLSPPTVEIVEVGPRDGLQNEAAVIPTDRKIALVDVLSEAGFRRIEVASFVSPKWVPQMADSGAVLAGIARKETVSYAALTPNLRGFEGAMAGQADEIAIFGSASEGFSKANLNATRQEALDRFAPVAEAATVAGIPMRGYVSCVTDCPYDGEVAPGEVALAVAMMRDLGCYEVSLGDTIGKAHPAQIDAMLLSVCQELPTDRLAGHFHDTAGRALANIEVALMHGLRVFDTAVGGLGGCPYAPGAAGNVATEAVMRHLAALGYDTGLDLALIEEAARMAQEMRNV